MQIQLCSEVGTDRIFIDNQATSVAFDVCRVSRRIELISSFWRVTTGDEWWQGTKSMTETRWLSKPGFTRFLFIVLLRLELSRFYFKRSQCYKTNSVQHYSAKYRSVVKITFLRKQMRRLNRRGKPGRFCGIFRNKTKQQIYRFVWVAESGLLWRTWTSINQPIVIVNSVVTTQLTQYRIR